MKDFYNSLSDSGVRVLKLNGKPVHSRTLNRVQASRLLRYRIEMHDLEVRLKQGDSGEIEFEFEGATRPGTYRSTSPAKKILEGIRYLGTFYDKGTGQFYF